MTATPSNNPQSGNITIPYISQLPTKGEETTLDRIESDAIRAMEGFLNRKLTVSELFQTIRGTGRYLAGVKGMAERMKDLPEPISVEAMGRGRCIIP